MPDVGEAKLLATVCLLHLRPCALPASSLACPVGGYACIAHVYRVFVLMMLMIRAFFLVLLKRRALLRSTCPSGAPGIPELLLGTRDHLQQLQHLFRIDLWLPRNRIVTAAPVWLSLLEFRLRSPLALARYKRPASVSSCLPNTP